MVDKGIRRPQKALTARFVETVKETGKHFDGHGLFLRVQPNEAKQWVQRITIRGKRCELGLRSTFRQWAAERGYDREMAEMALAHRVGTEVGPACVRASALTPPI